MIYLLKKNWTYLFFRTCFLAFIQTLWGSILFAQTVSVSSGVSQTSVIDAKSVKIYAGWANAANNCTTANATSTGTCDTCAIGGDNVPCNRASIHANLYLQIDVSSTTTGISGLPVQISTSSSNIDLVSGAVSSTATSSGYSMKILWSSLCNSVFGASDCNESTAPYSNTKTIYFGPVKDSKFVETISVEVNLSTFSAVTSAYTECASGATANEGAACYFKMHGGDEKIYVDTFEPSWNVDSPTLTIGSATLPVKKVVFFAAQSTVPQSSSADQTAYNSIRNSSDYFELDVQSGEDPLTDNRLIGFDNGSRYCFRMATMDITGNIQKFTPSTAAAATISNDYCAEANEVLGLLHDKKCFIATAAYGSSLNYHVQKFRDFRDRFLKPYGWGQSLISFYYEHGPYFAEKIKKNETLRALSRGLLWPMYFFVEIFLKFGLLWGLFSILFAILLFRKTVQLVRQRFFSRSLC